MTRKFEGSGPTEGMPTGSGFEAWLKKQEAKRATAPTTDDGLYTAYVSAANGEQAERDAGVARHLEPGGVKVPDHITDDEIYEAFIDTIDGTAGRRRAQETVRQERQDRQAEHRRHARQMGHPLHELWGD